MIEDMTIRKFAPKTQHDYLRDETAKREAQQIDFAKTESTYERDGIPRSTGG